MREGNAERGFTLLELMAVVAIVAILAAVVVPNWMKTTNKAKYKSEVTAMFTEIGVKEEQFKTENGKYMGLRTDANYEGTVTCPSSAGTTDYNFTTTCLLANTEWLDLRIDPPSQSSRCQYAITAGKSGTPLTPPTGFKNSQGATGAEAALAAPWYYVHATCDESGNGGTNAEYYMSSVDRKLQALNEGS